MHGDSDQGMLPAKKAYIEGLKRYKEGDLKSALVYFTSAIEGGIDDFDILYYRGMCHLDNGDYEAALIDFEVLVRKESSKPEWRFRRGVALYKLHRYPEALEDMASIPEDHDDFSIRWHYLAVLYYLAREYDRALGAIEKALVIFPTMPKIWFNAGIILRDSDLADRAELAFSTAARLDSRLTTAKREILD